MTRFRISISLDGQIGVFVEEGSYADAQELSAKLYTTIGQVAPIENLNPPEQHRHDRQYEHINATHDS